MNIIPILPTDVPVVWDKAKPLLQMAIDEAKGEMTISDVFFEIMSGEQMLFGVEDGGEMVAAVTMEIRKFAQKKVVSITLAGGTKMAEWYQDVLAMAEQVAKNEQAQAVYVTGRRGWVRQLARAGYTEYFTVVGKEVDA